jgi:hypothetical protein
MKQKFSIIHPSFLAIIILLVLPTILHAQTDPGDPGPDPAPIDGGVSIVAAACAGYLAKRKKDRNNTNKV